MNNSLANTTEDPNKVDVLIIGAGLSGLTSALKLQQNVPSLKVRILESSNNVGGQLKATGLGEIGAKWITEDQSHIYRLLTELKIPIHKRIIMSSELKSYREMDEGIFARLAKYELLCYIRELELKTEYFRAGYIKSHKTSMDYHIHNRLFFKNSRNYMMNLVLLITGVEARDISYHDFMGICYTCGGIKRLIDLLIEAPNYTMLEFSSKDLLKKIFDQLTFTEILLRHKAVEIIQYRDHVKVKDSENIEHIADAVILAVPWNAFQELNFWPPLPMELQTPPLPVDKAKFIITSFLASYREAHWRINGFSGHFVKHQPLLVAHEYRPLVYSGYIVHEEGIEPLTKSIILHELSKKFGEEMLIPIEFLQHSYDLPYLSHIPLTTPWNRVMWSSSAAAGTCYRGCLGGAVQSGIRAAMNALLVIRPQIVTWQDIAEVQCQDYLHNREATWISLWFSTWNLYNATKYTLFMCGLVLALSKAYTSRH